MRFIFYSPVHFEKWDWRNSVEKGIGGSETSHVEMAWRLARRGHEVISYAPIPDDCPGEWLGTKWYDLKKADFKLPGIWIVYRCPQIMNKFKKVHPDQEIWLMAQDTDYMGQWTDSRALKIDKVLALCTAHARALAKDHSIIANKIRLTSNGIKMDIIRSMEENPPERNPKKLIFASSPDRGLVNLIKIFKRAREIEPDLELHCFYGLDNIEKLIDFNPKFSHYKKFKEQLLKDLDTPGVYWRGRISQVELYREWLSAGIWCYPTTFTETSCITAMEAQALGAIPITNPYWALRDNVMHGIFIEGNPDSDALIQARYAAEIVRLATNPGVQKSIRDEMMNNVRLRFNWERWVDQWEAWACGIKNKNFVSQFAFQLKHARGKILNVGCDNDFADFKSLGSINMDSCEKNPVTGVPNKADILGDIRDLPKELFSRFDSVVLGDILEHMSEADAVLALQQARKALENGGNIIVTCPDDHRPVNTQHAVGNGTERYVNGVSAYHERPISKEELLDIIKRAGLQPKLVQEIDYTHFLGHGVVCALK